MSKKVLIYEKIVGLCKTNKTTVAELERGLKLGKGTIGRWKKCQPTVGKLKLVSDYFCLPLDYFVNNLSEQKIKRNNELLRILENLNTKQIDLVKCYVSIIVSIIK